MPRHPLQPPSSDRLLRLWARAAHPQNSAPVDPAGQPLQRVAALVHSFSRLPYENLTKIICDHRKGNRPTRRRTPAQVIIGFLRNGTGGTCFSLTAALAHLLRAAGWQVEPILADRTYGADSHCALLVWIDGRRHLIDPGYLITQPVPIDVPQTTAIATGFNRLTLRPAAPGRVDLSSHTGEESRYRLTYKTDPVDAGQFLRAWDTSYQWEMMRYPMLTAATSNYQVYLRGSYWQQRWTDRVSRMQIPPERMAEHIWQHFSIAPRVVTQALAILQARGEVVG